MRRAATYYRDGRAVGFDRVSKWTTTDLACVLEIERFEARVGGGATITPFALRVTTLLRLEDGDWRIVHRHADPITTARIAESVIGG